MKVPGYTYIEVGSLTNDPKLDVVQGVIIHVTGTLVSPLNFFDGPSNGIESHLYTPKDPDARREQYRDTNREADANFRANSWVDSDGKRHGYISWEFMGLGGGKYNKYQLSEMFRVLPILSKEHDFPLKVPTGPKSKGVGFHTQFNDWSNVAGKICPGPERIQQYWDIIVPWMKEPPVNLYTWKQGDTVTSVAKKFDLTVTQLWRLNPGSSLPFVKGDIVKVR